jgi:hypothetical protein
VGRYEHRQAFHAFGNRNRRIHLRIVVRRLRTQGTPAHADSPLQPVN